MTKKLRKEVCKYCNIEFVEEEIDYICDSANMANACAHHPRRRPKFKLEAVGPDFKRTEDDPERIKALQSLINDGAAWHPDIDQDGSLGRRANDYISRKICKPPRSDYAKRQRHMFDVAARFGIDQKKLPGVTDDD